jgi:opacity protein-like surface antigen
MASVAGRLAVLPVLLVIALPSTAAADWLITPYLGMAFARESTFLALGEGTLTSGEGPGRKWTVGGSVALIGDAWLGVEADVSHTPGFFTEDDSLLLVLTSRVTTVSGSVIVAAPVAVTRESLRPYLVGGLGLLQARSKHAGDLLPVDRNVVGLNLGAGAIGMVTDRTGLRFEFRYVKAITGEDGPFARPGISRLSFWRATTGVTLRY